MDNLTHTLVGVGMANAFYRRKIGKEAVPILAISSNLPDIDAIVMLSGDPRAVLFRRTFGHSLLILPVWIILLSLVFRRFYPRLPLGRSVALCSLGAGVHLLFDLINSFGVVLFWPISGFRPELATVFILDLALTGLLALPLLLCIPRSRRSSLEGLSRASVLAVTVYLLACSAGRWSAGRILGREAVSLNPPPTFSYVFPEPLGPQRWKGVLRSGDQYHLYLIHPLSGRSEAAGEVSTEDGDAAAKAVQATPAGRRLDGFLKAPVWRVSGEGATRRVTAYDLRFQSLVLKRDAVFGFTFDVAPSGEVREVLQSSGPAGGR
jgi:membrane-bound metal-dependent hydrolase YbcI (DUF457 family)